LKHDLASLKAALAAAPAVPVKANKLSRLVPQLALGASPNRHQSRNLPRLCSVAGYGSHPWA